MVLRIKWDHECGAFSVMPCTQNVLNENEYLNLHVSFCLFVCFSESEEGRVGKEGRERERNKRWCETGTSIGGLPYASQPGTEHTRPGMCPDQ